MDTNACGKSVLVVEDENLLRQMSAEELAEAGYQVIEAETVDEALKIMRSGVAVALVFTDVNTPGNLDGLQLANLLRENWPEVRVIVTSGGGKVSSHDVLPPDRFMIKPYAFAEMVAAVRELTDDPS